MGRWFLILPDVLIFISIFGFGFLVGIFLSIIVVMYNIVKGNSITIRQEEF
jgi:hypothetical protein